MLQTEPLEWFITLSGSSSIKLISYDTKCQIHFITWQRKHERKMTLFQCEIQCPQTHALQASKYVLHDVQVIGHICNMEKFVTVNVTLITINVMW